MSNSTSSAAATDAIAHSDDDDKLSLESEEVSDIFIASSDDSNKNSNDNDDNNDNDDGDTEEAEFLCDARDIQNRMFRCVGTAPMEDRRFHGLFGACIEIFLKVWLMLWEDGLCPKKSKLKHLLWKLYFLKVYPREAPGCSAVDGLKGAVNPKTLWKWVWLFIERIAELVDDVVSV